jgi:serine-type D-Ala-D-Ala carboxypeptidase (penicillin-binding protein 5/6)
MLTTMAAPVLERVERARRRRRQVRRRRATALLVLAALGAGAGWLVTPHGGVARPAKAVPQLVVHQPVAKPAARPAPLLSGPPRLQSHVFAPPLTSRSAILVDAQSGHVLYELRARVRRPIASTTKIMTALIALRRVPPTELVTVDPTVPRVPLVKEGLRSGERVRAWKLFYGMLLYSGNDDALALAIAAAGSRPTFVSLMNDEARRLGLHNSHFASPSGVVDRDNYSTAWDLAALTRVALRNDRFRTIVATERRSVAWSPPTFAKVYVNKNLLLGRYRGADGVKTGYTAKSGRCLVASATRGGRTLIAVVLHARDPYTDARRLLNLGFGGATAAP